MSVTSPGTKTAEADQNIFEEQMEEVGTILICIISL